MIRDLQRNHPTAARDVMRTTRVRSKVERSRSCAPLTKTQVWDSGFSRMRFSCKNPECYGFFWQCKRYNKKPRFLDFVFANVNGPTVDDLSAQLFLQENNNQWNSEGQNHHNYSHRCFSFMFPFYNFHNHAICQWVILLFVDYMLHICGSGLI